jgi:hypothetical protein
VSTHISKDVIRRQLEMAFEDVALILADQVEGQQRALEARQRLANVWETLGLGDPPESEIQMRIVGDGYERRLSG